MRRIMPLSETSARWTLPVSLMVFGLIFIFNAYRMGQINMDWYQKMTDDQRKRFRMVIIVSVIGILLILLIPMLFAT